MKTQSTRRGKIRKDLDKIIKIHTKLRDNNTCQWCGKKVEGHNCHASHVIPRSQGDMLRWEPLNLKVLCYHCHINKWHKSPLDAEKWFKEKFPDRWEYLTSLKERIVKWTTDELMEKLETLNKMTEELKQQQNDTTASD